MIIYYKTWLLICLILTGINLILQGTLLSICKKKSIFCFF